MGDAGAEAARLRSERALLKRHLLSEREAVTALKAEAARREARERELLARVDALAEEKARLSAVAAQLKQELTSAKQAQSAALTGGSMFNTLLSSADGSAAEIGRLQKQVALTEEELTNQIKNTAKVHEDMHRQRVQHAAQVDKLQRQASEALTRGERLSGQLEDASAELELARRRFAEASTQLASKRSLADELARQLEAKTEALRYVEQLRQDDLAALQARLQAKVPFDDTANEQLLEAAPRKSVMPRPALTAAAQVALELAIVDQLQRLATSAFTWVADLKRLGAADPVACAALTQLCAQLQAFARVAQDTAAARRSPQPVVKARRHTSGVASDLVKGLRLVAQAYDDAIARASPKPSEGESVLFARHRRAAPLVQNLAAAASASPARVQDAVASCSDIASLFRIERDESRTPAPLEAAMLRFEETMHDVFGQFAAKLHGFVVHARSMRSDTPRRRRARGFISSLNCRPIAPAVPHVAAVGLQAKVNSLSKTCAAQADKLERLEAQYQAARVALTAKEKLLADVQRRAEAAAPVTASAPTMDIARDASKQATELTSDDPSSGATPPVVASAVGATSVASSAPGGSAPYELVVLDTVSGDLFNSLSEFCRAGKGQSLMTVEESIRMSSDGQIQEIATQLRTAQVQASDASDLRVKAEARAESLSADCAELRRNIARLSEELREAREKSAEELAHTRESYDTQLQQLTQHLMRLQDEEQDREAELARLRVVATAGGMAQDGQQAPNVPANNTNPFA